LRLSPERIRHAVMERQQVKVLGVTHEAASVQRVLARNVRRAQMELGQSQTLLSQPTGLPQPTISQIEAASINITLRTLGKVAEAVGWPVRELLTE
jgi:hypothetical protein